jgi:hypothetical protein
MREAGAPVIRWDFFIAYTHKDQKIADELRRQLEAKAIVFQDSMIPAGVEWDTYLSECLSNSSIVVVLLSSQATAGYYQREEIAVALEQSRRDPGNIEWSPCISTMSTRLPFRMDCESATESSWLTLGVV